MDGDEANRTAGSPPTYSGVAVQCMCAPRLIYRLPLRAAQGLFVSLLGLLDCPLAVPHYSTVCAAPGWAGAWTGRVGCPGPRHVLIDSTGLKVFGEGEWKMRTHGKEKRRTWRKLHLAVDTATREILAVRLTEASGHRPGSPARTAAGRQGQYSKG